METEVGSRVMPVTGTSLALTVTVQVADLPPALAVMVVEPTATAVTVPLFTVATEVFELDQVTVFSVAFAGLTVAVRLAVSPTVRVTEVWLRATEETDTMLTGSSLGVQPARNSAARERAQSTTLNPCWVMEENLIVISFMFLIQI